MWGLYLDYKDFTTIMGNQKEKNMNNEMKTT